MLDDAIERRSTAKRRGDIHEWALACNDVANLRHTLRNYKRAGV